MQCNEAVWGGKSHDLSTFRCPGHCVCLRVPDSRKGLTRNQCEKSAPFRGRLRSWKSGNHVLLLTATGIFIWRKDPEMVRERRLWTEVSLNGYEWQQDHVSARECRRKTDFTHSEEFSQYVRLQNWPRLPLSTTDKETAHAGDMGSIPGSGRSPKGGMATHSSILAWGMLWTEEPGRLHSPWSHIESGMTEQLSTHHWGDAFPLPGSGNFLCWGRSNSMVWEAPRNLRLCTFRDSDCCS